jgi:hypothetical protein
VRCSSDLASGRLGTRARAALVRRQRRRRSWSGRPWVGLAGGVLCPWFVAACEARRIMKALRRKYCGIRNSRGRRFRQTWPHSGESKKRSTNPRWRRQQQTTARPWDGQCAVCSKPIKTPSCSHGRINLASPRRRLLVRQDGFSAGDPLGWFRVEANVTRNGPVPFERDIQYKPESLTPQPSTYYRRRGPWLRDR